MQAWVIAATVIYLVANLAIGFWRFRSTDYDMYVSARGRFGTVPISLSLASTAIGGAMFFTVSQMGYEAGTAVLALALSYVPGYALLCWVAPRIRKHLSDAHGHTLYDVASYRLRATPRSAAAYSVLAAAVTFGMYFFMLAGQFTILALFYQYSLHVSMAAAWVLSIGVIGGLTLVYTVVGGLRKDIATDVLQVCVISVGLVILAVALVPAWPRIVSTLPPAHLNMTGYGLLFPIGVLMFFSPAFIGRFDYWQRVIAARSDRGAHRAIWGSLPLIALAYLVFCVAGMYARASGELPDSSYAGLWAISALLPPGLFLVVVLSFYAALMSTADTLLNVAGVSLHRLVVLALPSLPGVRWTNLTFVRLATVLVGLAASAVVLSSPSIVDLVVGGFSSLVILTPSLLMILFAERPSGATAVWSLALGYGAFLCAFVPFPMMRNYAFMGGFLCACLPLVAWRVARMFSRVPGSDPA